MQVSFSNRSKKGTFGCLFLVLLYRKQLISMSLRIRAFLFHLAASVALAVMVTAIVFGVWYPFPLDKAAGVTEIFFIVLGVDVVIGPLLTFVVYKKGKHSLYFDLATIICLQLIAFAYGLWTVAEGRPAWLVFSADRFDLVQAYQIDTRQLDRASPEYRTTPWGGAKWVYAVRPDDPEQRKTILFEALFSGLDLAQRPNLYRPFTEAADAVRKYAQPLVELERFNSHSEVAAVLARWPAADAFLPMMSRVHPVTVLVNKESAQIIAIVDLNPWE